MEGSVRLFSANNLLMKTVGLADLFGETSLILGENRSLNAGAGLAGRTARKVPKTYISNILNDDPVFGTFLRDTHIRLMDSSKQRMELAKELEKVAVQMQRNLRRWTLLFQTSKAFLIAPSGWYAILSVPSRALKQLLRFRSELLVDQF